ncbi:hypothetical protein [Mycobacterium helveticum]|uniref:Uncharacterized protein n=1 Tax=Mycobacterium helveticum TaxID=2592811 RepID=A0A557XX87_9MYCO|nr:hypothetical protein [Mycobacterium helveticum]TVS85548.1 hypothetical protein FPZ46_14005 [Mycobacterium helveticum]TVS90718.1 hypothetical protein FPZ47_08330 [Mycobacterium helveticum]
MSAEYRHLLDVNHELRCRVRELEAERDEVLDLARRAAERIDQLEAERNDLYQARQRPKAPPPPSQEIDFGEIERPWER